MDVVILAAGLGSRLKNLTQDRPKAMVEVAGKPLINHALNFLNLEKIETVYVVGGYQFATLKKHLQGQEKVRLLHNPDFQVGSTLTMEKALPYLKDSFLLMNVDHIYPREMFEKIFGSVSEDQIIAMTDRDRELGDDDMKVDLKPDGTIRRISKQLNNYQAGYIGITFIGKKKLREYNRALEAVKAKTEGKANVEVVLDYMADFCPLHVLDLSGLGWHEVDTPEERQKAERALQ